MIIAIGQGTDPTGFEEIELTKGTIAADEFTYRTNLEAYSLPVMLQIKVQILLSQPLVKHKAANVICSYLDGNIIPYKKPYVVERDDLTEADFADREKIYRPTMAQLSPEERKHNFNEIVVGYTEEQAKAEAMRCLECGCHDYFECKLIQYANEYEVEPEKFEGEVHHRELDDTHPFIHRNPDKCILCGLCVRVCEEVMGNTALGLVDRGFDTIVKPALGKPLKETDCISCGQCVALCPTGALGENFLSTNLFQ